MNNSAIRRHLEEAVEQLAATVRSLGKKSFTEAELLVELGHVFHHLNTAWHVREIGAKRQRDCSDADFYRWRRFPTEKEMMLDPLPKRKKGLTSRQSQRPAPSRRVLTK